MDDEFIKKVFKSFQLNNISFCILRNAEEVKEAIAHDIDMTIALDSLIEAEKIMMSVAKEGGWILHLKMGSARDRLNIKCYHYHKYCKADQKIDIIHFDIFPSFAWNGYVLLNNDRLCRGIDKTSIYNKVNQNVEAVTKLFVRLLHNGYIKNKYKQFILCVFINDEDSTKNIMTDFLDSETVKYVYEYVIDERWDEVEARRSDIIASIKKKNRSRKNHVKEFFQHKNYLLKKLTKTPGLMIAFEGTDGSGKSTIINGLTDILENSFPKGYFDYYHWRPKFIKKNNNDSINITEPHSKKAYGLFKSFLKFMFFNIDYILGYWFMIRLQLAKGHLVVFDRYYYDYYLDKLRYRLKIDDRILKVFQTIIPKPSITFLLIGDAEILYERKKEIPIEEIKLQIERIYLNKKSFNNPKIIDVNRSINKVIYDVSELILLECASKY